MLFDFSDFSYPFTTSFLFTTPHTKYLYLTRNLYISEDGVGFIAYRAACGNLEPSPEA